LTDGFFALDRLVVVAACAGSAIAAIKTTTAPR